MIFGKYERVELLKKYKSLEDTLSILRDQYPVSYASLEDADCEPGRIAQISRLLQDLDSVDIEKVIDVSVNTVPRLFDTSYAALFLYEEATNELVFARHNNSEQLSFRIDVSKQPEPFVVYAMKSAGPILMERLSAYELETKTFFSRVPTDCFLVNSTISIPLVIRTDGEKHKQVGVLVLAQRKTFEPFSLDEFHMAFYLGELLATAVCNSRMAGEIRMIAETDGTTQLLNQTAFCEKLGEEINRSSRYNRKLSLIVMNFDFDGKYRGDFDNNDENSLLLEAASIIKNNIRKTDWLARYGDDKFAIILTETPLESAKLLAERLKNTAEQNLNNHNSKISFNITIGTSEFVKGESGNVFIECAEKDLLRSGSF